MECRVRHCRCVDEGFVCLLLVCTGRYVLSNIKPAGDEERSKEKKREVDTAFERKDIFNLIHPP